MLKELLLILPALVIALAGAFGLNAAGNIRTNPIKVPHISEVSVVGAQLLGTYRTIPDVTYCSPGGKPLELDLYIPDADQKTSFPLVVYVHGGSWNSGDKAVPAAREYVSQIAKAGYVVASINYRLAPRYKFPAQVQDVKCAIRFLREHARDYQIRPEKAAVIGESAGGYLASFAGVTGDMSEYQPEELGRQSDKVQAVVSLSGPSDFTIPEATTYSTVILTQFLGDTPRRDASPVTYISKDSPPFLLIHGDKDTTVLPSHSRSLHDKLQAAGVESELIILPGAGHGITPGSTTVSSSELVKLAFQLEAFLAKHLK